MSFIVHRNNSYIGTMELFAVQLLAPILCTEVGDVVTSTTDNESDSYYMYEEGFVTHTYYHNGDRLLCFSHTEHEFPTFTSEEEEIQHVHHLSCYKSYTNRLTGFKYNREGARGFSGARKNISYMKRDINRAARRVGKELTCEQIAA